MKRRSPFVRKVFASIFVAVVAAALVAVGISIGLHWSGGGLATPPVMATLSSAPAEEANERAVGKNAYVVSFSDIGDPLVLERARALWNSLKDYGNDVVAIIPRYTAEQLDAPLQDMGYRVLPRDGPAPAWGTSGRWVQQALAAIDSGGAGSGGDGSRDGGAAGHRWSLLGLEALALTEYDEVLVLDQKMVIFPASAAGHSGRGGARKRKWRRRRDLTAGATGGKAGLANGRAVVEKPPPMPLLPRLMPGGVDGVAVAFATAGRESVLAPGMGVESLAEGQRAEFSGQHPALMVVRPSASQYDEMSAVLCKDGDIVFSHAYPDIPESGEMRTSLLQSRVSTAPLLHLAVASLSQGGGTRSSPRLPLEVCGGSAVVPKGGAARSPIVWCPCLPLERQEKQQQQEQQGQGQQGQGQQQRQQQQQHQEIDEGEEKQNTRQLQQRQQHCYYHEEQEKKPENRPVGRRLDGVRERVASVGGNNNGGAVIAAVEGNVSGTTRSATSSPPLAGRKRGEGATSSRVATALTAAEEEQTDPDGAPRFAWIPADPCSCVDAPGVVGEACRGWLWARAGRSGPDAQVGGLEEQENPLSTAALSACKNGVFASPSQLPPPTRQQASLGENASGLSYASRHSERPAGEGREGSSGPAGVVVPPPPLWQQRGKSEDKAVVTAADQRGFAHFWLANVEKKLLIVAIPKVACTQLHALFLRLQGSKGWDSQSLSKIHFHKDQHKYTLRTMAGVDTERASEILNDPSWTKAVFLRDPAERFLSCYLDKIVHRRSYSVKFFDSDGILSFQDFVALTSVGAQERFQEEHPGAKLGLTRHSNPHWKPQLYFGLDKFLPYFDFVGDFQHAEAHSEALLRHAGLWEEFGASGWGPHGESAFFQRTTVKGHATGSHDSKARYLTPPLWSSVVEAYGPTDYRMLAGLGWWNQTANSI